MAVADLPVQLGEVEGALTQHFLVRAGAKGGLTLKSQGLGVRYQEEVLEFLPIGELGVNGGKREVLELTMSEWVQVRGSILPWSM